MSDDQSHDLFRCLAFFMVIELRIAAHRDMAAAERIAARCPGWARFLRRRAKKNAAKADVWAGGDSDTYKVVTDE